MRLLLERKIQAVTALIIAIFSCTEERAVAQNFDMSGHDTVTVVCIGDVMMHEKQLHYNFKTYLKGVEARLSKADLAIANMEFTLAGRPYSGYPAFSAPDSYASYAADCGVDIFLTANNHILDKGKAGIERTISVYDKMESQGRIRYTGIALDESSDKKRNPLIVEAGGIRFGIVNFTYGTNCGIGTAWPKVCRIDQEEIARNIYRAREEGADFVLVFPHWGTEYQLTHSSSQESLADFLISCGADAIIGAHPHVVQDIANYMVARDDGRPDRNIPVIYSMGNAVSNMSAENTRIELAVTLRFIRNRMGHTRMIEPEITFLWCSLPGRLTDSYCTIEVKDYIGRRSEWKEPSDYDKMIQTYNRVKQLTGIYD